MDIEYEEAPVASSSRLAPSYDEEEVEGYDMDEAVEDEQDAAGAEVEAGEEGEDEEEEEEEEGIEEQAAPKKAKRIIKSRQSLAEKQPGTTLFPMARIKRIIKADKEVDVMSAEACFLVAVATEYFIKHFMEEGYTKARLDKRKIVNYRDLVSRSDEFGFLQDVVPQPMQMSEALEKRKRKQLQDENPGQYEDQPGTSTDQLDTLPPLTGSTNPLFPNAVIKRPANTHAKGAGNSAAKLAVPVDAGDEEEEDGAAGIATAAVAPVSKNGSTPQHAHGTRRARRSMAGTDATAEADPLTLAAEDVPAPGDEDERMDQ